MYLEDRLHEGKRHHCIVTDDAQFNEVGKRMLPSEDTARVFQYVHTG